MAGVPVVHAAAPARIEAIARYSPLEQKATATGSLPSEKDLGRFALQSGQDTGLPGITCAGLLL